MNEFLNSKLVQDLRDVINKTLLIPSLIIDT